VVTNQEKNMAKKEIKGTPIALAEGVQYAEDLR
jgi:hypothetical protein